MKDKNWTGERLETFIQNRDTIDHLHRYAIAANYTNGKTVLDIASGEGYGTNLLAGNAAFAYGVDIDAGAIANAQQKYKKQNLKFSVGSADSIPLEDRSVDVVVSFETLEHHDKHQEMMREVKRVLKPGGLLLLSTPDKLYYSDKRNFQNQFHVKELYKQEFVDLVSGHFKNVQLLSQTYINGISLIREDKESEKMTIYSGNFSKVEFPQIDPFYLIALASDYDFDQQQQSVFDGSDIINEATMKKYTQSHSYRIGYFLLAPLRLFKKI